MAGWLGPLLIRAFEGLFGFFVKTALQRFAFLYATLAIWASVNVVLWVAFHAALAAVGSVGGLGAQVLGAMATVVPDNAFVLVSGYAALWTACEVYKAQGAIIKYVMAFKPSM